MQRASDSFDTRPPAVGGWRVERGAGELRIHYGLARDVPQYAALHLRDSYLRLNAGPCCGWGTSVILLPVLWRNGRCHHGAPVDASWREEGARLALDVTGTLGGITASLSVTFSPPSEGRIVAYVAARLSGDLDTPLDDRPDEAFKPVMLSSMFASRDVWDARAVIVGRREVAIPTRGWILPPSEPHSASTFGLRGGSSGWKANAPTVTIALDRVLAVRGWVTRSDDPNDDSVGLWAGAGAILPSYAYRITASMP